MLQGESYGSVYIYILYTAIIIIIMFILLTSIYLNPRLSAPGWMLSPDWEEWKVKLCKFYLGQGMKRFISSSVRKQENDLIDGETHSLQLTSGILASILMYPVVALSMSGTYMQTRNDVYIYIW